MNARRTLAALGGVLRTALGRNRLDLAGRCVLVTGGGRGLGLQIAREAGGRGARLALIARSAKELEAAREEFEGAGFAVATAVGDVRDVASVRDAVAACERLVGPVEVVFNVAGVIEVGPVDALVLADYENAIETNFLGAVRTVEAVRAAMCARGSGRIVNITSLGGKISIPHLLPYSASKFALVGYSEGLRAELARYGVVVTTIVPGLMRTGSPPQATFAGQPKKEYAMFAPSDSLPFTSISVERAAREIVDACERGEDERILSIQAKGSVLAYRLVPGLVRLVLALVSCFLPDAGGSTEHRYGHESEGALTRSPLNGLGRQATRSQREDLDLRRSAAPDGAG